MKTLLDWTKSVTFLNPAFKSHIKTSKMTQSSARCLILIFFNELSAKNAKNNKLKLTEFILGSDNKVFNPLKRLRLIRNCDVKFINLFMKSYFLDLI